ncbi:MAG: hypothetical protein AB7W59_08185 [Acidimicrobiia bacterium]
MADHTDHHRSSDDVDSSGDADGPSAKQLLHWATGDREAEAEALADDAGVDLEAAETAVKEAHGDLGVDRTDPSTDVADADDARRAAADHG